IFVADYSNFTIRRITPDGMVTTIAGIPGIYGCEDGVGSAARFYYPGSIAADPFGNIYAADTLNNSIRKAIPVPQLTSPASLAPAQFQFTFASVTGTNYGIQYAKLLTNWTSMGTVIGTGGQVNVVDTNAVDPSRVYRVVIP